MARWGWRALKAVAAAVIGVLLGWIIAAGIGVAAAHEFYSGACCNETDCKPYLGTVEITRNGFWVPEFGAMIPFRTAANPVYDARKDGARYDMPGDDPYTYHLCELPWKRGIIRCFYAKLGGV